MQRRTFIQICAGVAATLAGASRACDAHADDPAAAAADNTPASLTERRGSHLSCAGTRPHTIQVVFDDAPDLDII